jgi:hypothetical protein
MLRKILIIGACMLIFPCAVHPANAADMPTVKYSHTVDFEANDPVKFWVGDKMHTINFKGVTDEKSAEGRKYFKLDVTFGSSSYLYWCVPMPKPVPAEGRLKFTGKVFLGQGTTARTVQIAPTYSYLPGTVAGTCPSMYIVKDKDKWLSIQGDLVDIAMSADLRKYDWGNPELSNAGRYLTDMVIRLYGNKGDRVVLYLDDFKVEGQVPAFAEYGKEIIARWAPIKARIDKRISEWENSLARSAQSIKGISAKGDVAEKLKKEIQESIFALEPRIKSIKTRGAMTVRDAQQIGNSIKWIEEGISNLPALISLGNARDRKLTVTVVPPISSVPILPAEFYGVPGSRITVTAAQGEYEPASFVIHSVPGIDAVTVKAGDLNQGNKVIPAANIDIKVVKCWYQAGSAWYGITQNKLKKVMVPELLLNDDSLVKVDTEKEENYLKLSFPDGEKYVCVSNLEESAESIAKSQSVKDFPVKDSPVLLPVDIPANGIKQFWVTVYVPENTSPGIYTGKIQIVSGGGDNASLTLNLKVLPFKLPKPYYDSSIYYCSVLDPRDIGSISSGSKSRTQLAAELKNMVEHGITNPITYQGFDNKELLKEHLAARAAAGMDNDPLYYLGFGPFGNVDRPREFMDFARENGIREVYFYGKDEAKGDALIQQREKWTEIHKLGGKVFVAGYKDENFKKMGDIQDLCVCAFYPYKEEAEKWHSAGRKVWCYGNPQGGVENPEINRRNYGLLLWQNNYDGACTFAYQYRFGNIWNDFDHPIYRDHNFTYPTVDGVIDTIAWEGYREGVDDIRYLTKLQQMIAAAEKSKDRERVSIANQAGAYLKTIDADRDDLNAVRTKMIDYIIKLN